MNAVVLRGLSYEQRDTARLKASTAVRQKLVEPSVPAFSFAGSKYPGWLVIFTLVLCVVMFIAAFLPSSIRLYDIGYETFYESMNHHDSAVAAGISMVVMAETGAILFTLALAVLSVERQSQAILLFSIGLSTSIALLGNYEAAISGRDGLLYIAYLEALAPPVLTLSTSYILKGVVLNTLAEYAERQRRWRDEMGRYEALMQSPEQHEDFLKIYRRAIWDLLVDTNKGGKMTKADLLNMPAVMRRLYVQRELGFDNIFELDEQAEAPEVIESRIMMLIEEQGGFNSEASHSADSLNSDYAAEIAEAMQYTGTTRLNVFLDRVPEADRWQGTTLAGVLQMPASTVSTGRKARREQIKSNGHVVEAGVE
jgi:hypothetical protein